MVKEVAGLHPLNVNDAHHGGESHHKASHTGRRAKAYANLF